MNLFFSGVGKGLIEMDPRLGSPRFRLFSCHEQYFKYAWETSALMPAIDKEFEIMYDSGAFTAWSKGDEVTLDPLIETYSRLVDKYHGSGRAIWLINLDKIPGSPGRTAEADEVQEAIRISDENFHRLVDKFGPCVVPVFHQGEEMSRLDEICAQAEYVCVSPRNDVAEKFRVMFAREAHARTKTLGRRTHGLATTGWNMMSNVPWHSVDSATWIMIAAYGHIYLQDEHGGVALQMVSVSEDSPNRYEHSKHYDNLCDAEKDVLNENMKKWGFELDLLKKDFVQRAIWNRLAMSELYRSINDVQLKHQPSLYG